MNEVKPKLLFEIGKLKYGEGAFSSKLFNIDGKGLPLIRIRGVQRGFPQTYYSGEFDEKYLVDEGSYLIDMDGAFALDELKGGKVLLNQRVCLIESVTPDVDLRYLVSIFPKYLVEIEAKTSLVMVKHLSAKVLKSIEIPLPGTEEKQKLANTYFL